MRGKGYAPRPRLTVELLERAVWERQRSAMERDVRAYEANTGLGRRSLAEGFDRSDDWVYKLLDGTVDLPAGVLSIWVEQCGGLAYVSELMAQCGLVVASLPPREAVGRDVTVAGLMRLFTAFVDAALEDTGSARGDARAPLARRDARAPKGENRVEEAGRALLNGVYGVMVLLGDASRRGVPARAGSMAEAEARRNG